MALQRIMVRFFKWHFLYTWIVLALWILVMDHQRILRVTIVEAADTTNLAQKESRRASKDVAIEEHFQSAKEYNNKNEYDNALEEYKKALDVIVRRDGESAMPAGDLHFYMGISHFRSKRYKEALAEFDKALGVYFLHRVGRKKQTRNIVSDWNGLDALEEANTQEEDDIEMMADLYYAIGLTHYNLGKEHDDQAIRMWEQAWILLQRREYIPSPFEQQNTPENELQRRSKLLLTDHALENEDLVGMLLDMSDLYMDNGKYKEARVRFQDTIYAVQEMISESDKLTLYDIFYRARKVNTKTITSHVNTILMVTQSDSPLVERIHKFTENLPYLSDEQVWKEKLQLFQDALAESEAKSLSEKQTDNEQLVMADWLFYIGETYVQQWKLQLGLDYAIKALQIYEILKEDTSSFDTYVLLSRVNLYLGQYEDAMIAFDNANNLHQLLMGGKELIQNTWNEDIQNTLVAPFQINVNQYLQQVPNATKVKQRLF